MRLLFCLTALAGLLAASTAHGGQWNGGGYIGIVEFDSDAADAQGVDESAETMGGFAEFQTDTLIAVSMGGEFVFYDDDEEFTAWVEYEYDWGDDDTGVESSDAYAMHLFGDIGPRWQFDRGYASVAAGYSGAVYSERSITNCSDCPSEDIDLDGGGYAKAAAGFRAGVVNIGLMVRTFVSGDIDNEIYLTVGTAFD